MFKGIYTPVVTPFDENEEIDYGKMKLNLDKWGKTDLDGIVVLGSNGEFVYLTEDEKLELVKFTIENFTKEKKIIVGTTCESTRGTISLSNKMADLGADAVLILPPNYFKGGMKEEVLYKHYTNVADGVKVPVMIYNMPGNTGINLSSGLVARLSKHPNIVGIKDTSGNIVQLSEIVRDTDDDFAVFAGNAGYLLPALAVGARGATLALANILPDECCKLVSLFREGKMDEARELQKRLLEPNFTVTGRFGVPALKYALDLLGYGGGYPRRPLLPLSEDNKKVVEEVLKTYGAL
ncbi:4-hydroxy-tetrahydrodipicolinate synthase [Lutispora saccharofermentans]|uniref:4-hydroxy-tetrahydrodipicolinate synthase n=1 Tax=Lutispora saccharofermentans TaxID=3024236 RepID=A0ABT1NMJ9_9FIRM|nr:4-hydroxy-tetrahydrodipicolinate synthase [Lutispora saccharofermentans]MCQ1531151.1 4-hydroxy-tetrahydrodipicolinate synthase [Lutispora saccharofermentans]